MSAVGQLQRVAEQQPDLHVAADQPEEGAERLLGIVEGEQPGRPAGLEQRLQPLADGEAAIGQHDRRRDCSCPSRHATTATRFSAIEVSLEITRQPVGGKTLEAFAQRGGVEPLPVVIAGPHLRGLPLHGRRQQPVAVAEPFVERFLGAAGAPRHRRHGQRIALLDQQPQRRVEHLGLPLRGQCFIAGRHLEQSGSLPGIFEGLALSLNRTVRYGSAYGAVAAAMQATSWNFPAGARTASLCKQHLRSAEPRSRPACRSRPRARSGSGNTRSRRRPCAPAR